MKLTVTVDPRAAGVGGGSLPVTGAPQQQLLLTGLLAIVSGLILLQLGRASEPTTLS
jgi:hypothetical protein